MDIKQFLEVVPFVIEAGFPVMVRGGHGKGKSEVIKSLAAHLIWDDKENRVRFSQTKVENPYTIIDRRAAQMQEGDMIGVPHLDSVEDVTRFKPLDWFKTACDKPCLVFLDEVDRAINEVRMAIFELLDSRKLNGRSLHPGTRLFAAINGGEGRSQYSVHTPDPAELDRWTVVDLEPTHEDFFSWARLDDNLFEPVLQFLMQNPQHLEHSGTFAPGKVYPSRRSWKRFADTICNCFNEIKDKLTLIGQGFVGIEAAASFNQFVVENYNILTVADFLNENTTMESLFNEISKYDAGRLNQVGDSIKDFLTKNHNVTQTDAFYEKYTMFLVNSNPEIMRDHFHMLVSLPDLDEDGKLSVEKTCMRHICAVHPMTIPLAYVKKVVVDHYNTSIQSFVQNDLVVRNHAKEHIKSITWNNVTKHYDCVIAGKGKKTTTVSLGCEDVDPATGLPDPTVLKYKYLLVGTINPEAKAS